MSRDVIGDLLTIIRNGLRVSKRVVSAPYSKEKAGILAVLKDEGFIKDFIVEDDGSFSSLKIVLKYVSGAPAIQEISRISKPGRRHYERLRNLTSVVGGLGVSILSTNKGIITSKKAKSLNVGGEVLCHVW